MGRIGADVIVIGAGAAGLMCAATAARRGRRVALLDHRPQPGEKIRASGGGHCNFTNLHATPEHYLSENPSFCISALRTYTPQDFMTLLTRHGLSWREKKAGQLFCEASAGRVLEMLLQECREAGVGFHFGLRVGEVTREGELFQVGSDRERFSAPALVIASGGLARPRMGASGFGYGIARRFGLGVVEPRPALTPLNFAPPTQRLWGGLAGLTAPAEIACGKARYQESLLFTHDGVSGPAVLQISSHWHAGEEVVVNFAPEVELLPWLKGMRQEQPRQEAKNILSRLLPQRLASRLAELGECAGRMADLSDRKLRGLAEVTGAWRFVPGAAGGYGLAEVTAGGVDTRFLSSRSCACREVPGLYFIGEVVDVTGELGGFNLQWAWSSGFVAGQAV